MSNKKAHSKPKDRQEEFNRSTNNNADSTFSRFFTGFMPPPYMPPHLMHVSQGMFNQPWNPGGFPPGFMPPPFMPGSQGMFNQPSNPSGFPPGYAPNNTTFLRNNLDLQLRSLDIQKNQIMMTIIQMENQLEVINKNLETIRAEIDKLD